MKAAQVWPNEKVLIIVFFVNNGEVLLGFFPEGRMANKECCLELKRRFPGFVVKQLMI